MLKENKINKKKKTFPYFHVPLKNVLYCCSHAKEKKDKCSTIRILLLAHPLYLFFFVIHFFFFLVFTGNDKIKYEYPEESKKKKKQTQPSHKRDTIHSCYYLLLLPSFSSCHDDFLFFCFFGGRGMLILPVALHKEVSVAYLMSLRIPLYLQKKKKPSSTEFFYFPIQLRKV